MSFSPHINNNPPQTNHHTEQNQEHNQKSQNFRPERSDCRLDNRSPLARFATPIVTPLIYVLNKVRKRSVSINGFFVFGLPHITLSQALFLEPPLPLE